MTNLYDALRARFPAGLDDTAIEVAEPPGDAAFAPLRYTWGDLERGSARMAGLFADLGLAPGARVLVHADKSAEAVMLYLAVLRAGLVHVPVDKACQADEVEDFLGDAEPALVVCSPRHFAWVSRLAFARGTRFVLTLGDDRSGSLLERAAQMPDAFETRPRAADDVAVLVCTSGATGRGKGARLTHGDLLADAEGQFEACRAGRLAVGGSAALLRGAMT